MAHEQRLPGTDLLGHGAAGFLVDVGQHHFGAFPGQQNGVFLAHAAGGPGDDGDLVLHPAHVLLLR